MNNLTKEILFFALIWSSVQLELESKSIDYLENDMEAPVLQCKDSKQWVNFNLSIS